MSYPIDFVGLVCFYRQQDGSRLALLPDGRQPPSPDIARHVASLVIASDRVIDGSGWESGVSLLAERMQFELPECEITMDGTEANPVALDVSKHDGRLPNLKKLDGNFAIDPANVPAMVKFHFSQGNLEAFRRPGSNDTDKDVAMVTRLTVPYHQNITISVKAKNEGFPRTIVLLPNTEIVISNIERREDQELLGHHIRIYEKLSSNPVNLAGVPDVDLDSTGEPRMHSTHPFFRIAAGIGAGADCSNTGCCPNPGGS